jgi:hypothetical protein
MLVLMFDLRFKSMQLDITYLSYENDTIIVVEYYEKLFLLLFAKANELLMSINVEKIEVYNFKSTLNFFSHHINECKHLLRPYVKKELIGFCWYHVDVENCICALSWWHKEQKRDRFLTS